MGKSFIGDNVEPIYKIGDQDVQKIYIGSEQIYPTSSLTAFLISSTAAVIGSVCALTANTTVYHDGVGVYPVDGDIVYSDSGGTTPFVGAKDYYKMGLEGIMKINASGVASLVNLTYCGL